MRLRCLADHCIFNAIIEALRAIGVEVVRLREALPTNASVRSCVASAYGLACEKASGRSLFLSSGKPTDPPYERTGCGIVA